jgi:hypothetical protein
MASWRRSMQNHSGPRRRHVPPGRADHLVQRGLTARARSCGQLVPPAGRSRNTGRPPHSDNRHRTAQRFRTALISGSQPAIRCSNTDLRKQNGDQCDYPLGSVHATYTEQRVMVMGAGSATARNPRRPGYDQATSGPAPPLTGLRRAAPLPVARRTSAANRLAGCHEEDRACGQRCSRHGATVVFRLAYPAAGAAGPGRVRVPAPITCSRAAARPSHPANG